MRGLPPDARDVLKRATRISAGIMIEQHREALDEGELYDPDDLPTPDQVVDFHIDDMLDMLADDPDPMDILTMPIYAAVRAVSASDEVDVTRRALFDLHRRQLRFLLYCAGDLAND